MMTSGWALRRTVDPPIEPLSVEEGKVQCEIDEDITDRDDLIGRYIKAARELAEEFTRRTFIESTWRLTAQTWPYDICNYASDYAIVLPRGPILAVTSISYLDNDGTRTYLEAADYYLADDDEPARLYPAYQTLWPTARLQQGSIEIIYRAGYPSAGSPADAEGVPAIVKQAISMLVAHWFNNAREDSIVGTIVSPAPHGFYDTLQSLRIYP
jgi:uncharacterized phiE125 gp8 family phage protein